MLYEQCCKFLPNSAVKERLKWPDIVKVVNIVAFLVVFISQSWCNVSVAERALYVCETSFHPLFSLTQGTSRLPYKYAENRWHTHCLSEINCSASNYYSKLDRLHWFSQRRSRTTHFWGRAPPNSNSAEISVQCTYCQVSSFCVYSFESYHVDKQTHPQKNKQTPLKTFNVFRYITKLGN